VHLTLSPNSIFWSFKTPYSQVFNIPLSRSRFFSTTPFKYKPPLGLKCFPFLQPSVFGRDLDPCALQMLPKPPLELTLNPFCLFMEWVSRFPFEQASSLLDVYYFDLNGGRVGLSFKDCACATASPLAVRILAQRTDIVSAFFPVVKLRCCPTYVFGCFLIKSDVSL